MLLRSLDIKTAKSGESFRGKSAVPSHLDISEISRYLIKESIGSFIFRSGESFFSFYMLSALSITRSVRAYADERDKILVDEVFVYDVEKRKYRL